MRVGLVAVGAAIAILGAGVVVTASVPFASSQDTRTGSVSVHPLNPGTWWSVPVNGTAAGHATVTFSWSASEKAEVEWYAAYSCSTPRTWCITGGPLAFWYNDTNGEWSTNGSVGAIYSVWVNDTTNRPLNFTGEFHEAIADHDSLLPMLPLAWTVAGGALLIGMGGVAIYLGLFLPSGVYATPSPDDEWGPYDGEGPYTDDDLLNDGPDSPKAPGFPP